MNVINVLYSKNNIFEINKTTYNMRDILTGSITLFLLFFGVYQSQAQSFWTETFGAGCNSGVIADGFSSTNGIWEVTSSVANTDANVWYISSAEGGAGVGNCSEGCVSDPLLDKPTLHIGSHNTDLGAIYTSDQVTDARAESPIINCKSRCNIELSFEYFKSGSEFNENLSVWYNDSTGWVELEITPTTSLGTCVSNGLWTQRSVNLPASADNNPKVQVGFRWENDGAGSGTKPSAAIYNIQLSSSDNTAPIITCPNLQIVHNGINCNYQITDYTTLAAVTDNCSALTLTQYPSVGTEIGTGDHIVHLLAVDASGNSSTCSFTLSVWENESPTIICPSDIATCDPVVTYDAPIVVENCSNYTLNQDDGTGLTSGDNFPVGVTIQSYLVSDASGNTETCSFTVEVFELPDSAKIITLPESYCEQKNVVLEAESVISGTGEWKVIEGTSSVNNEFATTTGVNNLSYGNNTFVWTVSTASCGSQSDTVTIQVFENPTQAFTQDQLVLCNDTLINIAATSPSVGTGSWSEVTGNASFLDPSSANTVLYNLNEGWNEIVWTVSNGACPSTSDTINVFKKSIATIYTPDTTVCLLSDDFTLSGSPVFEGVSALWYVISGGVEFENQESSSPTVTQLNGGKNIVVYGQNHPVCGTTTDTLIVIGEQCEEYNPNIPTVITPNAEIGRASCRKR